MSWPALRAEKRFAPAAKNLQKLGPFTILSNPGMVTEIVAVDSSPELVWTWSSSDSPQHQTLQKKNSQF
ncbi:hypothetical protein N7519_011701 [Penicillium mononematosum]|uniref:uncharacterized protein n=1 Tax=Penicillium mononematosum TaxID=268346 RepID=UPI002549087F|nr:uncharacterized protein N7519_011701 [Penicillium mononematosum]KAJ6181240.1 hypothetical protein N7519_011701 [Penicillium mononematosum]